MTSHADNPTAFPSALQSIDRGTSGVNIVHLGESGMTLRDYFAAKALQGMLSGLLADGSVIQKTSFDLVSKEAYSFADAMLKARQA